MLHVCEHYPAGAYFEFELDTFGDEVELSNFGFYAAEFPAVVRVIEASSCDESMWFQCISFELKYLLVEI